MKKRILSGIIVVVFLMGIVGCATVKVEAPAEKTIQLSSVNSTPKRVIKKRVFYALWGLVPLSPNSTADMFNIEDTKSVKVKTYLDAVDYIITVLLSEVTITSRTVEIQVSQ